MWPASALLTGNGVAFVLRVPGTEHGDWWSLHGWWIFAGTAAVALLSKYVVIFRGRHVFNPSNFGLVLCFLLIGPERADPLPFWWGPMSVWLALALVLIVGGGLAILRRLRLVAIAVGFWLTFAAGIGVLAAGGHEMTAAWHLGPIGGLDLWWLLVTSPEILVFLFFMITDPRTIPTERRGAARVRRLGRIPRRAADGAVDDGVRAQGRAARRARARLRGTPCSCSRPRAASSGRGAGREGRRGRPRRRRGARRGRGRRAPRARGAARAPGGRGRRPADTDRVPQVTFVPSPGLAPVDRGPPDGSPPTSWPTSSRGRGASHARPRPGERGGERGLARGPLEPDRRVAGGASRSPTYDAGAHPPAARARRRAGAATRRRDAARHDTNDDVRRPGRRAVRRRAVAVGGRSRSSSRQPVPRRRGSRRARRRGAGPLRARLVHADGRRSSVGLDFRHGAFRYGPPGVPTRRR